MSDGSTEYSRDDPWPTYDVGPSAHAHALGVLSINYNALENIFLDLHIALSGAPEFLTIYIFEKSANPSRNEIFNKMLERVTDANMRAHLAHFAKAFDICSRNRNTLLHSRIVAFIPLDTTVFATKRTRKDGSVTDLEFTLEDIRRIADETFALFVYGNWLSSVIGRQIRGMSLPKGAEPETTAFVTLPVLLPTKMRTD